MNEPFNAWIQGIWFYGPILGLGAILLLIGLSVMMFFRDFPRTISAGPNEVVSPADGTVVAIEDLTETPHYDGPCKRISIFMSVFNAHVNRAPFEGTVRDVRYAPGHYINAMNHESSQVNESNAMWLDTPKGPMTVRQISGAIARRIVCPVKSGTDLRKGEKYGMIRFGSRVELYLPAAVKIDAQLNDKVHAGISILARFI
ncbi:MAG TPA: phosphatidylserine decarboxylase [Candidatus Hydrogenedentes bacterium]|nr:phosphatidylserine decarboxylase [Candidatus Hydrogenedentota bacterium]